MLAFGARSTTEDLPTYVVATTEVVPGKTIEATDLGVVAMDLYSQTAEGAYTDPESLIGSIALTPIAEGNLVQRSSVADAQLEPSMARNVGLSLDPADALNGALRSGDRVDVISQNDDGAGVLIRSAVVTDVASATSGAVGSLSSVDITLSVANLEEAAALISAKAGDGVTLVSASGIEVER